MKTKSKRRSSGGCVPRHAIGALPYRFGIRMPLTVGENGRSDRLMKDVDFEKKLKKERSIYDFILSFIKSSGSFREYSEEVSGFEIPAASVDLSVANEIRCVARAGKYGYESELLNVKTSTKRTRTVDDCELKPFVCRIVFTPNHQSFIVIFEKFGNSSCVGAFVRALNDYVKSRFQDKGYVVEYGYITNLKYVATQFRDNVKAIRFIKYKKAGTLDECLDYDDDSQEMVKIDVRISAKRGGFLKLAKAIKDYSREDFKGVVLCNESYQMMNVELKSGGRTQTVVAGKEAFLVPFDLTGKLKCSAATGHPDRDDFCEAAQECLEMSKVTIYGKEANLK